MENRAHRDVTALVASIIDMVETTIRDEHPDLEEYIDEYCEGNTLLHGEGYYELEDEIIEMIEGD